MSKITFNDEKELVSLIRQIVQEELYSLPNDSEEEVNSLHGSSNETDSSSWFVIGKPQPDPAQQFHEKKERPRPVPVVSQPYRPDLTHLETLPFSPSIPLFL
ncbi:hypothetical protein [Hazenella coriacea]|uniref:Uncharacterized protein n=1 Tax=Hazenella coriacea TaxID=1179467 RepID=A0A4V2UV82_9BACL|nr:hypothetical protein [Hazenella coriacea]TCS94767.1 hypothetical protein EDD58_103186 [Hazenella coriacea]